MLTFFTVLKPCVGRTALAQRQAVASWIEVAGAENVLLLGDEAGVGELSEALGTRWLPEIARNGHGTPLLHDAIAQARATTSTPLLCFINGDIVVDDRFAETARIVADRLQRFLLVGQCINLDVPDALMTGTAPASTLVALAKRSGTLRGHDFVDYFVFNRDLFTDVPPFALGRAGFDNWLIWSARAAHAAVVNATQFQLPIHQNHAYDHLAGGVADAYRGEEAAENLRLADGRLLTTLDSTHLLTPTGIRIDLLGRLRLRRRILLAKIAIAGRLPRSAA